MKNKNQSIELEFYKKEGISPVHYKLGDIKKHFEIRSSLYQLLGLPPNLVRGKDVLEVAPGSGHNSIYTASLLPETYDLVEPNPVGCKDIHSIFKHFTLDHTKPKLKQLTLGSFQTKKLYDIVITEGWPGGYLDFDKKMLRKLSSFVKPKGLMLISFFPPIGGMATYLRRLIGNRIIFFNDNFKNKTDVLSKAFASHLGNLKSMSRSNEHWIQDSILNPYICVAHNTPNLCLKILKNKFEIYNSVPKFNNDWRWYKSLHGQSKSFNKNFISEYNKISHSMIDYRIKGINRCEKKNIELEKLCFNFASLTKKNEKYGVEKYVKNIEPFLLKIIDNIKQDLPKNVLQSLIEVNNLLKKDNIKIKDVSKMKHFSSLFGREQCYLSLINKI
jgi:hypothetical protein